MNKHKYLIAVSGGPDSMALLDMSRRKYYVEVAHVNYHKRDTANRDENIVKKYCKKYNIKFHLLDVYPIDVKGNFQAYARIARYEFFRDVCKENDLQAVLVAHQKDDLIETYLMQIDKKIGVNYYGLEKENILYGVKVIRPLLNYRKKQLSEYCELNNIEYGIDESNLTNHYQRNIVRHNKVELLNDKQIDSLINEIDKKNNIKQKQLISIKKYLHSNGEYTLKQFEKIPYLKTYLRIYFKNKSDKFFDEMIRQIKTAKSCKYNSDNFYIVKEYNKIHTFIYSGQYSYTFNSIDEMYSFDCEFFKIRKKGSSFEGVSLTENDFPITIRTNNSNDFISMTYGTKKINRYFIDNKIYLKDRLTYPVVCNVNKEVVLIPGIGCNVSHYSNSHNIYVIKK